MAPGASVAPLVAALKDVRADHPQLLIDQFGELSAEQAIDEVVTSDLNARSCSRSPSR